MADRFIIIRTGNVELLVQIARALAAVPGLTLVTESEEVYDIGIEPMIDEIGKVDGVYVDSSYLDD